MMTISLDRILQKNCFPAAVLCACALPSKHYLRSFFKTSFSVVISSDIFPHVNICVIPCVYFIRDGRGNFLHDMPFDFWQKHTYAYLPTLFTNNLLFLHASNANKKWILIFSLQSLRLYNQMHKTISQFSVFMFLFHKSHFTNRTHHTSQMFSTFCVVKSSEKMMITMAEEVV